jgi:hypothetical protein
MVMSHHDIFQKVFTILKSYIKDYNPEDKEKRSDETKKLDDILTTECQNHKISIDKTSLSSKRNEFFDETEIEKSDFQRLELIQGFSLNYFPTNAFREMKTSEKSETSDFPKSRSREIKTSDFHPSIHFPLITLSLIEDVQGIFLIFCLNLLLIYIIENI